MDFNIESECRLSSSKRAKGSKFVSFEIFVFVTTQASVETNTNQTNLPNIDKALKQKSRRLKIRVIRIIRVRKNHKQFVVKII